MKKNLNLIALGASILLIAVMLILFAAPGLVIDSILGTETTALGKLVNPGDDASPVGGSVAALILTVLAAAIAIALCVLKLLKKDVKIAPWCALCAAVLVLVAAILFFCTRSTYFAYFAKEIGSTTADVKSAFGDSIHLGAGAIVNGIFGILAACGLACYGLLGLKK